jgi:hypothetical protein
MSRMSENVGALTSRNTKGKLYVYIQVRGVRVERGDTSHHKSILRFHINEMHYIADFCTIKQLPWCSVIALCETVPTNLCVQEIPDFELGFKTSGHTPGLILSSHIKLSLCLTN